LRLDLVGPIHTVRKLEMIALRRYVFLNLSCCDNAEKVAAAVSSRFPMLCVVRGPPGTGKSTLVNNVIHEERQQRQQQRGAYLSSSLVKIQARSVAQSPLDILRSLLVNALEDYPSLETCQERIQQTMTEKERQILTAVLLGSDKQKDDEKSAAVLLVQRLLLSSTSRDPSQATIDVLDDPRVWIQIKTAIRSLLRIVLSQQQQQSSLIWVLDEIQNADARILEVLQFVLTDEELSGRLACCVILTDTHQQQLDDGVTGSHNIQLWIEEILQVQAAKLSSSMSPTAATKSQCIQTIVIDSLTLQQTKQLLAAAMRRDETDENVVQPLAKLLYERTMGNLFSLIQFLEYWQDREWMVYHFGTGQWNVTNLEGLRRKSSLSENVANVLCARMQVSLPRNALHVLQLAALFRDIDCIDHRDLALIVNNDEAVFGAAYAELWTGDEEEPKDSWLPRGLEIACEQTMLISISEHEYKFTHERIKDAAYQMLISSLIKSFDCEDEAKAIHLRIGLLLLDDIFGSNGDTDPLKAVDSSRIFACADQFVYGLLQSKISKLSGDSRLKISQLLLETGSNLSQTANNFDAASKYLVLGIKVLKGSHESAQATQFAFQKSYRLSVELHLMYAHMEINCGRTENSQQAANAVLLYAREKEDTVRAMMILIRCHQADFDFNKILSMALDLLAILGEETFPRKPSRWYLQKEVKRTIKKLKESGITAKNVKEMPHMDDNKIMTMNVLHKIIAPAMLLPERHPFFIITASRMARLTLEFGLCECSGTALSSFALCVLGYLQQPKEALELADISIQVIDSVPSLNAGLCLTFCGMILTTEPSRKFLAVMENGIRLSLEGGEANDAFFARAYYNFLYFYDGIPLQPLLDDVESSTPKILDYNKTCFFLVLPVWECLSNLTGKSSLDVCGLSKCAGGIPADCGMDHLLTFQMQAAFYGGENEKALELKEKIDDEPGKLIQKHCPFYQVSTPDFSRRSHQNDKLT